MAYVTVVYRGMDTLFARFPISLTPLHITSSQIYWFNRRKDSAENLVELGKIDQPRQTGNHKFISIETVSQFLFS
jgi:hypothetical protein